MNDRWSTVWFVFCGLLGFAMVGGFIFAVVELWPHLIGMLDRVGQ
jgi:hypothetical protein